MKFDNIMFFSLSTSAMYDLRKTHGLDLVQFEASQLVTSLDASG